MVTEYKPRVTQNLADQEPHHLSEMFIQAYYLRRKFTHKIMHCLTDLRDFHYFLIKDGQNGKIIIDKYIYLNSDLTLKEPLANHMNFLHHYVDIDNIP